MGLRVDLPSRVLHLEFLVLDVNGTLTCAGVLMGGVAQRLRELDATLQVRLLTADTFGTAATIAEQLGGVPVSRVADGVAKAAVLGELGEHRCVAVGNGANDEPMLRAAGLGIAVLGPEGASPKAIAAADVVCPSILVALDLLADPRMLTATLRS